MLRDNFLKFWLAQNANVFVIAVTGFVLPIIAVVNLQATATEVSLLFVAQELAVVCLSLVVGVWLDRLPTVRTLTSTHSLQALLLVAGIWLLWLAPSLALLYGLALALGVTKLVLELGYATLLPGIVQKHRLVSGNSRLLLANAGIGAVAPSVGGAIIKFTAPALALAGALVGALVGILALQRLPEPHKANDIKTTRQPFAQEIKDGMCALFANPLLRPMMFSSCAGAFAVGIHTAVLIILLSRHLSLDTLAVGLLVSLNSLAIAAGSVLSPSLSRSIGLGRGVILGNLLTAFGYLLLTCAGIWQLTSLAIAGLVFAGFGSSFYVVNQTSIRQAVTPPELMARVHASRRFVVFSFLPIGSLTGGLVTDYYGIASSMALACIAMVIAALITLMSPLRQAALRFT